MLGVPEGLLRGIALVTIIGVGLGLLIPGIGHQLEKVFYRLPNRGPVRGGSAFVFGLTLGVVFVPCAGPVLAAITVLAASQGLSTGLVVLTLAFAAGLGDPTAPRGPPGRRRGTSARQPDAHGAHGGGRGLPDHGPGDGVRAG